MNKKATLNFMISTMLEAYKQLYNRIILSSYYNPRKRVNGSEQVTKEPNKNLAKIRNPVIDLLKSIEKRVQ